MTVSRFRPLNSANRLRKLRAMSADEVWSRVRYSAYCRIERVRHSRGMLARPDRLRNSLTPALARSADWRLSLIDARRERKARFFAGVEERDATRALFVARFPAEHRQAREESERALRGEFSFFGQSFRYPNGIDWNADPVTKAQWPRVYHRDVPVDGGNIGFGDVKYVWELGRQQFLIDLAKVWAIDRESRCAAAARRLVIDWHSGNGVGTGVGWSCALEPAFRVLSWLWGYFLTVDDPEFDTDSHIHWLEGFRDHGTFLYRHLEYYASPFNHLIGEACALYCLGTLFPEFHEASKWRTRARQVLESRLPAQYYADGGSVEQSTFYHHATTGFYLLAALLGRENREEFSPSVWTAIERAIEFSALLQQPDGTTPRIGGADDGKPIRLEQLPFWDFRPYQAMGAVLFGRSDFKVAAGRYFEDALWLLGPSSLSRFEDLGAEAPPPSQALESSGYVVIRNRWAPDADYLCFDCGEQAAGLRQDDIPSAAHGHADCLSIIVWRGGRPVLVDAGFHCYNGPKAWQDHFRETAAHNTLRVDSRDQAMHINKMAWAHTYAAKLEAHQLSTGSGWALGSHDGYRSLEKGPVVHRRAVWARTRGYIVVCDFLEGAGSHHVDLTFQFAPGNLRVAGSQAEFENMVNLRWFAEVDLSASLHEGGPTPDAGWVAPSLGVKVAAPRLVLSATMNLPATLVCILSDTVTPLDVSLTTTSRPGPIRVAGHGWEDWLLVRGYGDGGPRGLETDAIVGAWRSTGGRFEADGHIAGTFQRP